MPKSDSGDFSLSAFEEGFFDDENQDFCLSDKISPIVIINESFNYLREEDVKEFVRLIQSKVLMYWKGQNEFIDWLNKKAGEKLSE